MQSTEFSGFFFKKAQWKDLEVNLYTETESVYMPNRNGKTSQAIALTYGSVESHCDKMNLVKE